MFPFGFRQGLPCMRVSGEGAHGLLPNDVTAPSSPSLLFRANLLIFGARLDEAVRLGRAATRGRAF